MTPGTERWKEEDTALARVWSVGVTLSRPRSAKWVAEEAEVSERTARRHLARLVEMGMLEEVSEESPTMFQPDPLYIRLRGLRDILNGHDDLEGHRSNLEEQIDTWQSEYRVESPETLRRRAARTDTANRTRQLRQAANEWKIVRYRLGLIDEAIHLSTE